MTRSIFWVADVGSNHNGDMKRIEHLIVQSALAGFNAIKFQLFDQELYYKKFHRKRAAAFCDSLPLEALPSIHKWCKRYEIEFHCTPFYLDAVEILNKFVDAFKIGSYEIFCSDLITECLKTGKPIGLSCGFINQKHIGLVHSLCKDKVGIENVTLYNCSPIYPALPGWCELNKFGVLAAAIIGNDPNIVELNLGWSDHSCNEGVLCAAAFMSPPINHIEMHIDLNDRKGKETRHGHVWTTSRAGVIIKQIKDGLMALNTPALNFASEAKWMTDPFDMQRPAEPYRKELEDE